MSLFVEPKGDALALIDVGFLDDEEEAIEANERASGRIRADDESSSEREFHLAKQVDAATIRVNYWSDRKDVLVPFDITTGLGLGEDAESKQD